MRPHRISGLLFLSLLALYIILTLVNIGQNHWGAPEAVSAEAILGKPLDTVTVEDLRRLDKGELYALFGLLPAPGGDIEGEWQARLLDGGVMTTMSTFYTHRVFGPGRWLGKGLFKDGEAGEGYNLFAGDGESLRRIRRFRLYDGRSEIDGEQALMLDYAPFNRREIAGMQDELRQVRPDLLLGMGYMSIGGGAINPAPFAMHGPRDPWRGPDPE